MDQQGISVDVHSPRVNRVQRFGSYPDKLLIELGNGPAYSNTVHLFVDENAWQAIVSDVARMLPDAETIPAGKNECPYHEGDSRDPLSCIESDDCGKL